MTIVHVQTILQTTLAELDADGNVINPQNYQQTISVLSEDEFIAAYQQAAELKTKLEAEKNADTANNN